MDTILVLDYGGQTSQLISRRIRDLGYYSVILPGQIRIDSKEFLKVKNELKGIIFSGSPHSVYKRESPSPDNRIYSLGIPILGICYGLQLIVQDHGGEIAPLEREEYGRTKIFYRMNGRESPLFKGIPDGFSSWMSHGDSIKKVPPGFEILADSENKLVSVLFNGEKNIYGVQFHPEVSHCEYGTTILDNFAGKICEAKKEWSLDRYIEKTVDTIKEKVGDKEILLLISGGVDSSVLAALLLRSVKPKRVHLMYIDTGLMRKGESEEVFKNLKKLGAKNIHIIDARDEFLNGLRGITNPEKKRRVIGDLFIEIQERETKRLGITSDYLAQGTLYTDMIESGKGVGKNANVIKSHHNVRSPLVEKKRLEGKLIEPLSILYKDEVRRLGLKLGLSEDIVYRHPFPGPGLAVRILGEVTEEKCNILREADYIFIEQLKKRNLYRKIWQAFAVLLPVKSVGVTGDARGYRYVLALRAVTSSDGMTADVYPFEMKDILEISGKITNEVKEIGRVVYDVSSKPPATIEWE